ncbi:MAG: amidase [Pseudomonadota bacterium]
MHQKIAFSSLVKIGQRIQQQKTSSLKVTEAMLERIEALDPKLGSYVNVLGDRAMQRAKRADREIAKDKIRGPLHGVPVAVKDLCDIDGEVTTAGLPMFSKRIVDQTATVVKRLEDAGAVILGKLHLTEGALADHHPDIAPPINPWAKNRWSGASSSGSGVAAAAGLAFATLGSDTGGSIRFPSAANGVVGLKPSWGRVSRYGVFPLSETLDHIGPLTRSVEDAAAVLAAIAGADSNDPTAAAIDVPDYLSELRKGVRGVRIGIDRQSVLAGVDPAIKAGIEKALRAFRKAGAKIISCSLPDTDAVIEAWTPICAAEAAIAHQQTYPRRKQGYSKMYSGFLDAGRGFTARDYANAQIEREKYRGAMLAFFNGVDLYIKPVNAALNPTVRAFENRNTDGGLTNVVRFTAPDDMAGLPTITLPSGLDKNGSPLAFQLVARGFEESLLFRAGAVWQRASDWRGLQPPLA